MPTLRIIWVSPEFKSKLFPLCTYPFFLLPARPSEIWFLSQAYVVKLSIFSTLSVFCNSYTWQYMMNFVKSIVFSPISKYALKFLGVCCQTQWRELAILRYLLLKHLSCFSPTVCCEDFSESSWIVWLKWNYFSSRSHKIDRRCNILQHLGK